MASHDVTSRPPVKLISWKPHVSGSMVGFVDVRMPSGLEIFGVLVHVQGSRRWCAPPGKLMLGPNGQLLREPDGRPAYGKLLGFMTHGVRSSWSRQILAALDAEYPDAAPARSDTDDPRLVQEMAP
jgi:hypothetical protein